MTRSPRVTSLDMRAPEIGYGAIAGEQRAHVLLRGPGDDNLDGGQGNGDICYGGGGNDTFTNCETQYP